MTFRHQLAGACLVGLASLTAASGCKRASGASAEQVTKPEAAPKSVKLGRVETQKLPRVLDLAGSLLAWEESQVAAPTGGVVTRALADVGERVKKGDVLVTLDARDASLRLASARATERQQRAALGAGLDNLDQVPEVRAARDADELARREAERSQKLLDAGVIAPSAAEQSASNAEHASAALARSRGNAEQARAALDAARAQARISAKLLGDTKIVAPFDGAVIERPVSPGEFAPLGSVVAVVVSDDVLRLKLAVPETAVLAVAPGAAVSIVAVALPDKVFSGTIRRIAVSVDPNSRTQRVEADVPNADHVLRPGFFVRAKVDIPGTDGDVLTVPRAALGSTGSSSRVFVKVDGKVAERLVTPGRVLGDRVEVVGNLKAGDEIAIDHLTDLADGDAIVAAP